MKLPAEREATGPIFRDEVIEDHIAFALIETLFDQHRDDDILEFLKLDLLALFDRAPDEPKQRHPRHIVTIGSPCFSIGITKHLLPLPCRFQVHCPSSCSSASFMVEGPGDRRKRNLAESEILKRESVAQSLESNDRNLF
jgi:hypothetical protein